MVAIIHLAGEVLSKHFKRELIHAGLGHAELTPLVPVVRVGDLAAVINEVQRGANALRHDVRRYREHGTTTRWLESDKNNPQRGLLTDGLKQDGIRET